MVVGLAVLAAAAALPQTGSAQIETEGSTAHAPPALSDTLVLGLEAAEARALERNPVLSASRREEGIARGEYRQARVYRFNPVVEFETKTLDPAPGAGSLGRYEAVISQELEWAGQWGLRRDAGELGLRAASASVEDAVRRTLLQVREAFYAAVAAQRRAEVAADMAALTARLRSAVGTELDAGEVSVLDANLAEIEYGRGRARILEAERELESARLQLKRVIGMESEVPIRVQGDRSGAATATAPDAEGLPDPGALRVDSLTALALGRRPDLRSAEASVGRANELERLARREAIPNLRLTAPIERERVSGSPDVGLGVGLSVPLWNRNQGTADARQAASLQARDLQEAVVLGIRIEVRDAVQAYRRAWEAERALESSVLGPAAVNLGLVETSYQAGKIDLTALLFLQNQLLDARMEYWDAWLAQRRAHARLRAAVGEENSQ